MSIGRPFFSLTAKIHKQKLGRKTGGKQRVKKLLILRLKLCAGAEGGVK